VLDVHVNRSPAHGVVTRISHKAGRHLNALNPDSAEANESVLVVLEHPVRREPVAAVRQVAGLLARTVVCAAREGVVLQRGQRFGIIKLGSTTELYVPRQLQPVVQVQQGQYVYGGLTILLSYSLGPAIASTGAGDEGAAVDSDGHAAAAPAPAATGDPSPEAAGDDTSTGPATQANSDPVN
jgi:phosphatidylserine decarboxylase